MTDHDRGSYDRAFSDLRDVYLEDSWVLDLAPTDRSMSFVLDAVLKENHSSYQPPTPGE